jgi:hypothetical protein
MPVIEIIPDAIAEKMAIVADALQLESESGKKWLSRRGNTTPAMNAATT